MSTFSFKEYTFHLSSGISIIFSTFAVITVLELTLNLMIDTSKNGSFDLCKVKIKDNKFPPGLFVALHSVVCTLQKAVL